MGGDDPTTDDVAVTSSVAGRDAQHGGGEHKQLSPWARLWEFLRPERADIWIVVIFALFNGLLVLAVPIAIQALVNNVAFGTLLQPLIVLSVILLTCLGFAAGLRFLEQFVVELIQQRLLARVVARLAWQLPRVQLSAAHDFTPELVNRFFDIVTMQKVVSQLLLEGLTVLLTVGLGMIVLGFYHPLLLAFDVMLLVLLVINVFLLGRGAVRTSIVESKSKYAIASSLEDIARCQTTFKTGGVAEFALLRADRLTTDYLVARKAHYRVLMRQIAAGLAIEAFASAVLLGLGGWLVIRGQLTLGQLVAAELIVTLIVTAVAKFSKHLEGYYDLMASMDKLGHLFDLPVEPSSGLMHLGHTKAAQVSIRHVHFTHGSGASQLRDVTFDVAAGEVIAITGPAGCGKSTLLDLLFRLREQTSGRLVLDDLDIGDLRLDVLRQHVALVRDSEIVSGTLVENVHLDRPDISMTDVRAALHRVGLDDNLDDAISGGVIARRDQHAWGLNTPLSSDGRPLSASQARRLMLARALAGKPRLLLIDGLLDTLPDADAEQLLNELKSSRESCSVLLVTSRKSLVEQCDRILEL